MAYIVFSYRQYYDEVSDYEYRGFFETSEEASSYIQSCKHGRDLVNVSIRNYIVGYVDAIPDDLLCTKVFSEFIGEYDIKYVFRSEFFYEERGIILDINDERYKESKKEARNRLKELICRKSSFDKNPNDFNPPEKQALYGFDDMDMIEVHELKKIQS